MEYKCQWCEKEANLFYDEDYSKWVCHECALEIDEARGDEPPDHVVSFEEQMVRY